MNDLLPILSNRDAGADGASGALPEWIQLAPKGEFAITHGGKRYVQVLDDAACNLMVAAFANRSGPAGLLVDYDHFSLDTNRPSEAAGWIKEVQARPDGLWGRVQWTDRGADAVRNRRYIYISPTWNLADCQAISADRIRPARMRSAGLTNEPNMVGIKPIVNRADEAATQGEVHMDYKAKLIAMLGLPAEATDEQIAAAIEKMSAPPPAPDAAANRALVAERDALKNRVSELEQAALAVQVDADLEQYKDVIANRDDAKKALLANRENGLAMLKALRPADAALHNRADAKPPAGSPAGSDDQKVIMNRQREAVAAIRNRDRCSFDAAFARAQEEKPDLFVVK